MLLLLTGHYEVHGDLLHRVPCLPGRAEQPVLVLRRECARTGAALQLRLLHRQERGRHGCREGVRHVSACNKHALSVWRPRGHPWWDGPRPGGEGPRPERSLRVDTTIRTPLLQPSALRDQKTKTLERQFFNLSVCGHQDILNHMILAFSFQQSKDLEKNLSLRIWFWLSCCVLMFYLDQEMSRCVLTDVPLVCLC